MVIAVTTIMKKLLAIISALITGGLAIVVSSTVQSASAALSSN